MTVRELLKGLEGVPLDTTVEMEVFEDDLELSVGIACIASVVYDEKTPVVILREAL